MMLSTEWSLFGFHRQYALNVAARLPGSNKLAMPVLAFGGNIDSTEVTTSEPHFHLRRVSKSQCLAHVSETEPSKGIANQSALKYII